MEEGQIRLLNFANCMLHLKEILFNTCQQRIEERISSTENAITMAREASLDDTKSSAGDKYETTREMMQQEISRNEQQLMEARKAKHALQKISYQKISKEVENGSIVLTDQGNFFIAISSGQVAVENQVFQTISSASPIGRQMLGLKAADSFTFNGRRITIQEVS